MVKLFHLHFYCNDLQEYESFFIKKLSLSVVGRFKKDGELLPPETTWDEITTQEISLRLIELQRGGVNIVLMPGKFQKPKLEHFGLFLDDKTFEKSLGKAKELELSIKERPNRVFISSKMGFRIEIHRNNESKHKISDEDFDELSLSKVHFCVEEPQHFCELFNDLFDVTFGETLLLDEGEIFYEKGVFELRGFEVQGTENHIFDGSLTNDT